MAFWEKTARLPKSKLKKENNQLVSTTTQLKSIAAD